jgi:hypothetical protein
MLAGFSGHLISEFFLEQCLERSPLDATEIRRQLAKWRRASAHLGPASSPRALLESGAAPLLAALGARADGAVALLKTAAAATIVLPDGAEPVAVIASAWGDALEPLWRTSIEYAARAGAAWCVLFNGTQLRLVSAARLYSRRYTEFDVDLAIDDERSCRALIFVMRASPLHALIDESERHSSGVCKSLRTGVYAASAEVFSALLVNRRRSPDPATAFEQALTIVYRLLFLLFAEARHLVPLWHPIYKGSYSVDTLCDIASHDGSGSGLWDAIRAVSRLAHAGCRIGDLHVTAFNGRLFAPSRTPLVERRGLDDRAAQRAIVALATRQADDRDGRERIAYRDLGVEELGGVYESLLDYEPTRDGTLSNGSSVRKATGAFYTPRAIAEYLVRRTLAPLVRGRGPERILALRVLDPAMGSGAFLVAACSYLAQAYESALVASGACHACDVGAAERAAIRRTIAERCLFGVDVNPMAVQLARLSLWLATLAADRPLSFLDHHLVAGDSTIGAWLWCVGRAPASSRRRAPRDVTLPLFGDDVLGDAIRTSVPARFNLAELPNDTAEQVREKERLLAGLNTQGSPLFRWKQIANLWCARWFGAEPLPASAYGAMTDFILGRGGELPAAVARRFASSADDTAARHRFFHWELEFPEAFFDADGVRRSDAGFDAVIGNPPWDMVRADSGSSERRFASREAASAQLRFTRDSGAYSGQSDGHANRYQLFLERAMDLTAPAGRIGLVLPSGFAMDHGSAALRRRLFASCDVEALIGFENSARIFPIHRSVRFHLLMATQGRPTREIACRLGERDPTILESCSVHEDRTSFPVRVTPALLERLSGEDMAVPDLRSAVDVTIADRAASLFAPLGDENGWNARFGRELNATDDRSSFQDVGRGYPVIGGRTIEPFRVSTARSTASVSAPVAARLLGARCMRRRLAYRDVASATNRVTLIAAVLPPRTVSTHTLFCLRTSLPPRAQYFLCGLFNSFVVNYLVRMRVTTHVTTAIVEMLSIPHERDCPSRFAEISAMARLLARRDDPELLARLNAIVASLYQLSREEFAHVLDTFPLVPRADRDRALGVQDRLPRSFV